ncbi:MAG TPA: hypothetical protein VGH60_09325 [Solirubrobacteraceae bacterium]
MIRAKLPLPLVVVAVALAACATTATAASKIEGIWSFNGGQIAIQPLANGTYAGTVVAETKFAECTHPVGQQIWSNIRLQPDGSYWGFHQWYFETSSCQPNHTLGPTAWRVLEGTGGSHYLRACFSSPGTSQPTIAASGAGANVTYGCANSALIAPLPTAASRSKALRRSVVLPKTSKCFSRRVFQIHLHNPKNDPLKEVVVKIKGRRIAAVRQAGTIVATISLKGLPKGAFTVKIRAVTVLGHSLSESRTYHTCVRKAPRKKSNAKSPHHA